MKFFEQKLIQPIVLLMSNKNYFDNNILMNKIIQIL